MIEQIISIIREHKHFGITSHLGPEADAIGSVLAVKHLLEALGKETWAVMRDPVPGNLRFLPGAEAIRALQEGSQGVEAWFVVDCGQLSRVGEGLFQILKDHPLIVNIDHHGDNPRFGQINWVKPTASTTMILYELAQQLGVKITPDLATLLYAGIVADTDSFRNANVDSFVLRVAAELVSYGARVREIVVHLYERRSVQEMKLMGHVFLSAQVEDGVIWSSIPQEIFHQMGADLDDTERLAEELRAVEGVRVAVLFKELGTGKIKVSLRAKDGLDVSRVARVFGGGGHKEAAGCLIPGTLEEVEACVLAEVQRALEEAERHGDV